MNTDVIMLSTLDALSRDCPCTTLSELVTAQRHAISASDAKALRDVEEVPVDTAYAFKWQAQLTGFLKRYRFKHDLYTDAELQKMAEAKFCETQYRLADINLERLPKYMESFLKLTREILKEILGEYDPLEHLSLSKHGNRATLGVPLKKATEAQKWTPPITGSTSAINWFEHVLCSDRIGACRLDGVIKPYQVTAALTLQLVPKSYKSLRTITPYQTIDLYNTMGLGKMMTKRLRRHGLDIRLLQGSHKCLAKQASAHDTHSTIDLTAASDSLTYELLEKIMPKDWFEAMCVTRPAGVYLPSGRYFEPLTFCFMGNGFTFPLQTMVFYALIRAIDRQLFIGASLISVYGDDIICHRGLTCHVEDFFRRLGLTFNRNKTFTRGPFRESCGGDYYEGVDVRPSSPEGVQSNLTGLALESYLYQLINNLLRKWEPEEIPVTLHTLRHMLWTCNKRPYHVPPGYPDFSGICDTIDGQLAAYFVCRRARYARSMWHFPLLSIKTNRRIEHDHEPYYRLSLLGGESNIPLRKTASEEGRRRPILTRIDRIFGLIESALDTASEPRLIWRTSRRSVKRGKSFKQIHERRAWVVNPGETKIETSKGHTSQWWPALR